MGNRIQLKNVRLSFPSLFRKEEFNGVQGKYSATFLIPKDDAVIATIKAEITRLLAEAKIKVAADKICLRDGDEIEYDGYAGHYSIKASSSRRPVVIDRNKSPITEEDSIIYAGCRVNAIIDLWVQNNNYGKRVNCNLHGVQFAKDDTAFGAGSVDVTSEFDDVEGDDLPF